MKWGILATGTIAKKFAATVCQMNTAEETLAAVGSRSLDSAKTFAEEYEIPAYYDSYEAMLRDPNVEAVYIATPNHMHYANCMNGLQAGKHVLCEKPFTIRAEEARSLYRLAKKKGLFLMEAFWIRFLPLHGKLLEILKEGTIGELRHIRCEYGFLSQGARRERKFRSDLGGGALLDIGIYNLGFLHMLLKEAPEGFQTEVHFNEYGTDDFSVLQLRYPNGCTAHSAQAIGIEMERNAVIFGTKGSIFLDDFQHATTMTVRPYGGEACRIELPMDINGFEYQIREVSRCVAQGKCFSDIYTPEDNLTVLKLMDEIRESWGLKFTCEE